MLKIITFALAALVAHADVRPRTRTLKHAPAHVGPGIPLSTNGRQAREYSNSFSLHAIAGVSGVRPVWRLQALPAGKGQRAGCAACRFMNPRVPPKA